MSLCPQCKVAVVGHSLGGALATLSAFDLSLMVNPNQLCVFTYGSPRVGNHYFAQIYAQRVKSTWRFVHAADPIPHLPGTDVSKYIAIHLVAKGYSQIKQRLLARFDGDVDQERYSHPTMREYW